MGVGQFVCALALVALASASIGDNSIDGGVRAGMVAPVLSPPRDSRARDMNRSRQLPILVQPAPHYPSENLRENDAKSLEGNRQPIVQKPEDEEITNSGTNRQKRHGKWGKHGGGGGGGGGYGYQPVVIYVQKGGHQGGYGHQQPAYGHGGGCGGGCGGNYGGSSSRSVAYAASESQSYGRKR